MIFESVFEEIKNYFISSDVSKINEHIAVQVNLIGFGGGIFYVETDGKTLNIEPFEYKNKDAEISISVNDFKSLAEGSLNVINALNTGRLKTSGNIDKIITLYNALAK